MEKRQILAVEKMIKRKCDELGSLAFQEYLVIIVFAGLILLWFFRSPGYMTGWGDIFATDNALGNPVSVGDATAAVFMCITLFVLPSKPYFLRIFKNKNGPFKSSPAILNWHITEEKLHWGLLLLIGAGFALAQAADASCLSAWIGHELKA